MSKQLIIFPLFILLWQHCGKTPPPFPLPQTGSIEISATEIDGSPVDSIQVMLNRNYHGTFENPCILNDIETGIHNLFIFHEASTCTSTAVQIIRNEMTPIHFWLSHIGPYIHNVTPLFSTEDINGNTIYSEELKGKVVLLAFFEYT